MQSHALQAVVLAAGRSTRFNTGSSKLLVPLCGRPMVLYITQLLSHLQIPTTLVIGYAGSEIKRIVSLHYSSVTFVEQIQQLGTGHALMQTKNAWHADHILVLNGDVPLIQENLLKILYDKHITTNAAVTFVTSHHPDSNHSYGRVIRNNNKIEIVEAKDFIKEQSDTCCINAGIYLFNRNFLKHHLEELSSTNACGEYYITDLITLAQKYHYKVEIVEAPFDQIRGVNTLKELWVVEHIKRSELISYWMERGIRFSFAQSTHIDIDVTIGAGTTIGAGVHLLQGTVLGQNCTIGPFSILQNARIADQVTIHPHTIIENSRVESYAVIGPFAHIHQSSTAHTKSIVGNFVEITRSTLGHSSIAKHLTYLGDTQVGNQVNIGAGTITCNYDGIYKHATTINDETFIGSNTTIIAPLTIEKNAFIAAGSVITKSVPKNTFAITRSEQVNKESYVPILKERLLEKNKKSNQTLDNTNQPNENIS